jgi:hypothetical protein
MVFPPVISEKEQKRKEARAIALAEFRYIKEWRQQQGLGPFPPPPVIETPALDERPQPLPSVGNIVVANKPFPSSTTRVERTESSPRKMVKKMKDVLSPRRRSVKEKRTENVVGRRETPTPEEREERLTYLTATTLVASACTVQNLMDNKDMDELDSEEEIITALPPLQINLEERDEMETKKH